MRPWSPDECDGGWKHLSSLSRMSGEGWGCGMTVRKVVYPYKAFRCCGEMEINEAASRGRLETSVKCDFMGSEVGQLSVPVHQFAESWAAVCCCDE